MKTTSATVLATAIALSFTFVALPAGAPSKQKTTPAKKGTVQRIKVHGVSLEGNLEGDSADRDVSIYLPPGYATDRRRRFPVLYLLHGFTDSDDRWFGMRQHFVNVPVAADNALAAGSKETIIVMPNAFTAYQGSMYSNSATTGDWESFITRDLVSYVDSHYRTIASHTSRGLAGHSMGGYGTIRIGMKHPEVFSSIYVLSPCCLSANLNPQVDAFARAEKVRSGADLHNADFRTKAMVASAAAWSPNPRNPPTFFDLPVVNGQVQPAIVAKWAANAPLAMIDQHIPNLKKLRAIAVDAGAQDTGIAPTTKLLGQVLTQYEIRHTFEIYEGDHLNKIAERLEKKVLPFFSVNLSTLSR